MTSLAQGKGGGGLSVGKGGGTAAPATAATMPTPAGGKPVVQGPGGGSLASLFAGNQGYGGGGSGSVAQITQPTRETMGLPDISTMIPPRQPMAPTAPQTTAPSSQTIQQRIAQMQPNGATQMYSQNGGVNAMDANSGGKAQRFADYYYRLKYQNPDMAAQVLERSPYKSIFAPVQGAAPQQPQQPSRAAQLAAEINRRAGDRFA